MKRYILTAALAAAAVLPGAADGYNVVVSTADGNKHQFDARQVAKVLFSNDLKEYNNLVSAGYSTSSSNGIYTLTIGNGLPDSMGEPAEIGDSQIVFSFIAEISDDARNAVLPAGKYVMGDGSKPGTFDLQRSAVYLRTGAGDNGVEMMPILAGEVEVIYAGGDYAITGNVTTFQGFTAEFIYGGPIGFQPSLGESSPFDDDLDVEFEGAQMRFYGNWFDPFSDDVTVQLYTGEFDDNSGQIEGYWFNIDMHMPKVADPWSKDIVLADGVYTAEWRERPENGTYMPYTYMPGVVEDVFGTMMPVYTYITHKYSSGLTNLGVISSGTVTVSNNGTLLQFDLVMANGKKFTGKYSGKVACFNFHDADAPENIELLDSDVELEWTPATVALGYNDGQTILKDVNTYLLMIADPSMLAGDYLSLYLLTDKNELADGTYTVGKLENYGGIPGCVSYGGDILYSWYSDLSTTDPDGYQDVIAPVESGTVKVTTINGETKKFEMNLTTGQGKKITGSFEGVYIDASEPDEVATAARKNMIRKIRK